MLKEKAPPLSQFSKLLITASCEFEQGQGDEQSNYCPGYSDVKVTPYEGTKGDKLTNMAKVFCSHCQPEDTVCKQLFCPPEELIVNVTITLLAMFCEDIQANFPACYKEFCTSSLTKRQVRSVGSGYPQATNLNGQYECKASLPWSGVAGMDKWCRANCINGNDVAVCTEQFCDCSQKPTTTTTSSSRNQPTPCTEWEASGIYSGTAGMDSWCQSVCSGGRCPQTHCQCKVTTTTTTEVPSTTSSVTTTMSSPTSTTKTSTEMNTTYTMTTTVSSPSSTLKTMTETPTTNSVTATGLSTTSTSKTSPEIPSNTSTITTSTIIPTTNIVTTNEPSSSSDNIWTTSISQRTTTGAKSTTQEPVTSTKDTKQSSTSVVQPQETSSGNTLSSLGSTTGLQPTTSSSGTKATTARSSFSSESSRTSTEYLPSSQSSTSTPSYTISTAKVLTSTRASTTSSATSSTDLPTSTQRDIRTESPLPTTGASSIKSSNPSTVASTYTPTMTSGTTTTNGPKETSSAPSENSSTTSTGSFQPSSKTPLTTSTTIVSTKAPEIGSVTDEDSIKVIDDIVCDHAKVQGHNTITKRFCQRHSSAAVVEKKGYADDIVGQVLTFAPKLLCSLTDGTARTDACNNMFCGETPLSQRMVRSVLCNVCKTLIVSGGSMCSNIYC